MNEFDSVQPIDVLKSAVGDVNLEIVGLKSDIGIRDLKIGTLEDEKKFSEDQVTYWQRVAAFERGLKMRESEKFDESIVMLYVACAVAVIAIGYSVWVG